MELIGKDPDSLTENKELDWNQGKIACEFLRREKYYD